MDDDVWEEDHGDHQGLPGDSGGLRKLQETHMNEGYKAGIVAGQSRTTQEGFDKGYREGADYGLRFGRALGEMIGLSRLELDEGMREEVDGLVVEGNRLSQEAGKSLSSGAVEEYLRKCEALSEQFKSRE